MKDRESRAASSTNTSNLDSEISSFTVFSSLTPRNSGKIPYRIYFSKPTASPSPSRNWRSCSWMITSSQTAFLFSPHEHSPIIVCIFIFSLLVQLHRCDDKLQWSHRWTLHYVYDPLHVSETTSRSPDLPHLWDDRLFCHTVSKTEETNMRDIYTQTMRGVVGWKGGGTDRSILAKSSSSFLFLSPLS